MEKEEYVYHYTSIQSLLGMFSSDSHSNKCITFWASNILTMNDPDEFRFGYKSICNAFIQIEDNMNYCDKLEDKYLLRNSTFFRRKESDKKEIEQFIEKCICGSSFLPYIISCTTKEDDMDFWRNYAKDGNGVCIAFDKEILTKHFDDTIENSVYGDVVYGNSDMHTLEDSNPKLYDILCDGYNEYFNEIDGCEPECRNNISKIQQKYIEQSALFLSALFKRKGYSNEQEYRFAVLKKNDGTNIGFRTTTKGNIIPYTCISLPRKAIKDIMIGPCVDFESTSLVLKQFLMNKRFTDVNILKSEHKYRQY